MSKTGPECVICAEKHTPSNTATCVYCQYTTCRTCVRTYVLNETTPQCMNCKKPWTREHQNAILKPAFVNGDLKKHLEKVLFDRERAQFPATLNVIETRRIDDRLTRERRVLIEEISALEAMIRCHRVKIQEKTSLKTTAAKAPKMYPDTNQQQITEVIEGLQFELNAFQKSHADKLQRLRYVNNLFQMPVEQRRNAIEGAEPTAANSHAQTKRDPYRRKFVRACPIESCRGFLSTQWKCGLCNTHTCPTCHVPKLRANKERANKEPKEEEDPENKEEEHVCNPDDVATAELLNKDTKPCPKCGTGIFKIDGCDQMWCTECHSAFNWQTGQLETGHVHNPHFFEFQRRMGTNMRNVHDLPCNAQHPDRYHGILRDLVVGMFNVNAKRRRTANDNTMPPAATEQQENTIKNKIVDAAMSLPGFVITMQKYRQDAIQNNLELRVKYLTEEWNEAQFKSYLFRDAKKFNSEREIGQVVQTVVFAMTDILTRLIEYMRSKYNERDNTNSSDPVMVLAILAEFDVLMDYANECLAKICVEYKITRVGLFLRGTNGNRDGGLYSVAVTKTESGDEAIQPTNRR